MVIIMQPVGGREAREHENISLRSQVEFLRCQGLSESETNALIRLFPEGRANFWGNKRGGRNHNLRAHAQVDRIAPGDICAFVRKGEIIMVGRVAHSFNNTEFARGVWGPAHEDGQDYEFVYAIDRLVPTCIPAGRPIQGVRRVEDPELQAWLSRMI